MLTREDICTLETAAIDYGFDAALIPMLEGLLHGRALHNLGLQPGGYFYRRVDILEAVAATTQRMAA